MLPDLFPAAACLLAAQDEDAGGAGLGPVHARQFEALPDDRLAPGLYGTGADEQAMGAEVLVAVPGTVRSDRAEHRVHGLGPAGHEPGLMPGPAVNPGSPVPGAGAQQVFP